MTERQILVDELVRDEGIRLTVYTDTRGVPTIGCGRNLRDKGITATEALLLLDHDLNEVEVDLAGFGWFLLLDAVRQRVVMNMRFNLGGAGFRRFPRLLAALERRDYSGAAAEMRASAWYGQVKTRGVRLARMMETGIAL